jgi:hypothetical protein
MEMDKSLTTHPRNQWFKMQKSVENILLVTSEWTELHHFAKNIYALSFQERPSYNEYSKIFEKTI